MTLRSRERRQRGLRYTGVLRPTRNPADRVVVEHSANRSTSLFGWRIVSLGLVLTVGALLAVMLSADAFYVRSIAVGGLSYLTKEEIFAYADIANVHIFWVDPAEVRDNILRSPTIADARVSLAWPPNMVQIIVQEREPAIVWEQAGTAFWVDIQGRLMAQREDRPGLVRIVAELPLERGPLANDHHVSADIVIGALQLQDLLPSVTILRYDPAKGLGWRNSGGWDIWFGEGTLMAEKVRIYEAVAGNIAARGIQPGEINVVNPDAPFYTVLWGR